MLAGTDAAATTTRILGFCLLLLVVGVFVKWLGILMTRLFGFVYPCVARFFLAGVRAARLTANEQVLQVDEGD